MIIYKMIIIKTEKRLTLSHILQFKIHLDHKNIKMRQKFQ